MRQVRYAGEGPDSRVVKMNFLFLLVNVTTDDEYQGREYIEEFQRVKLLLKLFNHGPEWRSLSRVLTPDGAVPSSLGIPAARAWLLLG